MGKKCKSCGSDMEVTLRPIFFEKKLQIKNVPVYSCTICVYHELMEQIKDKVKRIISIESKKHKRKVIHFERFSEFAQLLLMVYNEQNNSFREATLKSEVQELIDDYLMHGVDDYYWNNEVHKKIEKLVH